MSNKLAAKLKVLRAKAHDKTQVRPDEKKDAKLDSEIKSAAGDVQEELAPIRRSAGHAHTH